MLSTYTTFSYFELYINYTEITREDRKPGLFLNISRRDAKFFSETGFFVPH